LAELTASVDYLRFIMNYAIRAGLDPDRIYRKAGFDSTVLKQSGGRISVDRFSAVWDALEEVNPDPDFGLHLGETVFNFPGHILFLVMLNAPTIREAIGKFHRYFNLMADFTSPGFSAGNDLATLSIRFHTLQFVATRQVNEGILSAYAAVLKRISENRIIFEEVSFVHPQPADISGHNRIFGAPLLFGQPENRLVFKSEYLSLPVLLSDREILETLERMAGKLQERLYTLGPWSDRVSRILIDLKEGTKPEIGTVARKLAVSARNLQNRLREEGTTYQKLADEIRKEKAVGFLENDNIPISEIGFLLGYAEQSVFTRAFKRWVGLTPGQYRVRLKQDRNPC